MITSHRLLVFSYATRHRGLRNSESAARPIAYVVFSAEGSRDETNFPTGCSVFGKPGSTEHATST